MIDIVFPAGNEDSFIEMAEKLGMSGLCFAYAGKPGTSSLKTKLKIFVASAGKNRIPGSDLWIAQEPEDCRPALESKNIDLVFGIEQSNGRDAKKNRNSGLDQVLCAIAAQKKKLVGIDIAGLITTSGRKRALLLGRVMQNISLCRKYKVGVALCSFARTPWQMRTAQDLAAVGETLGMHPTEAKAALNSVAEIISLNTQKKSGEYLGEGITRV